jgi:hypothetical protein
MLPNHLYPIPQREPLIRMARSYQNERSPSRGDWGQGPKTGRGVVSHPVITAMVGDRTVHGHIGHLPSGEAVRPAPR